MQNGDRVGVIYLPEFNGSLAVYINGAPLGIIATNVPENVYGFVELQGECVQVCATQNKTIQQVRGMQGANQRGQGRMEGAWEKGQEEVSSSFPTALFIL